MVPDQLRLIPVFVMLTNWHLINSFSGYILINLVTCDEPLLHAPVLPDDPEGLRGGGEARRRRLLQDVLAGHAAARAPAISALVILQFQGTWNDFFWPLILFGQGNPHLYTVQLGLAELHSTTRRCAPQIMAGSMIAIMPVLVIFVVFQRYFVSGVVSSGVKG